MHADTFPVRYPLYYPELAGESDAELAFVMMASYGDAVLAATEGQGQNIVDEFIYNDDLCTHALEVFKAAVERQQPSEITLDSRVTLVLTDDDSFHLDAVASTIEAVNSMRIVSPEE